MNPDLSSRTPADQRIAETGRSDQIGSRQTGFVAPILGAPLRNGGRDRVLRHLAEPRPALSVGPHALERRVPRRLGSGWRARVLGGFGETLGPAWLAGLRDGCRCVYPKFRAVLPHAGVWPGPAGWARPRPFGDVPGRVRKHPAISGLSRRGGGFPQAWEEQPAKPRPTERAHRANTRNAAQHRLYRGLACALCNVILVEVSAINPVSGLRRGRLAGSRPLLPGSRHSRSTGPPGSAVPTPGAGSTFAETGEARTTAGYSVKGARPLRLPRPGRLQQHRPASARLPSATQGEAAFGLPVGLCVRLCPQLPVIHVWAHRPGGHPQGCPSSSRGISMTALRRPSTPASTQPERRPRQVRLGQVSRARDQHR